MALAAEKELTHVGESKGAANHDHDLVHELSKRLDALWRYDQYIANATRQPEVQDLWRRLKEQEQANIQEIKVLIKEHCAKDCF